MENTPKPPVTPITQARTRRALKAELLETRRETDRLESLAESREFVQVSVRLTEGMGLTAEERIALAGDMYDFAESHGMPMSLAMCQAFFEHIEARASACVAESCAPAIVLAFRNREILS
jgi:hypothetical protein